MKPNDNPVDTLRWLRASLDLAWYEARARRAAKAKPRAPTRKPSTDIEEVRHDE